MSQAAHEPTVAFVSQMRAAGLPDPLVDHFCQLYRQYRQGDSGILDRAHIRPALPQDIVPYDALADEATYRAGCKQLSAVTVISLNGGLGTTMKLERAKSLLPVRDGLSFLDLTAKQILQLRQTHRAPVPWILMNSYHTRADSLEALKRYALQVDDLPLDFLQHKFPRIDQTTHLPLALADSEANWAPPGHGDVYLASWLSGLLGKLHKRGIRWAFVSNVDNLGGTVDPRILGYLEQQHLDFAMEVTDRTPADVKGGPLIRYQDRLMLWERSQVAPQDLPAFEDYAVFSNFNTNSLWWRVEAMLERMKRGPLPMPMIVNPKTVQGKKVIQLETAMGAGIGAFERARGILVPRSRFAPVKSTSDLLGVRSDAYRLDEDFGIRIHPQRAEALGPPLVSLDSRHYQGIDQLEDHFPHPLGLLACQRLTIEGEFYFGREVRMEGEVTLINGSSQAQRIPDGTRFQSGVHRF